MSVAQGANTGDAAVLFRGNVRSYLAVWAGLTLMSIVQNYGYSLDEPEGTQWKRILVHAVTWALPWFIVSPFVLKLDAVLHARRRSLGSLLAFHLLGMVLSFLPLWTLTRLVAAVGSTALEGAAWQGIHAIARPLPDLLAAFGEVPFLYAMILVSSASLRHARARREGEVQASMLAGQLSEARLTLLQRQLHPHFLFNALQAVSTLLHRDPALADRVLIRLSDLLRGLLDAAVTPEVTLQTEIEMTKRYLEIEEVRFQDRLSVTWDVALDEAAMATSVPALVLLPLVENAIRHGLSSKVGPGRLVIAARREGPSLTLSVEDDGMGPSLPVLQLHQGVGLGNTRQRIRALYGAAGALEVDVPSGGGFRVRLRVPARAAQP